MIITWINISSTLEQISPNKMKLKKFQTSLIDSLSPECSHLHYFPKTILLERNQADHHESAPFLWLIPRLSFPCISIQAIIFSTLFPFFRCSLATFATIKQIKRKTHTHTQSSPKVPMSIRKFFSIFSFFTLFFSPFFATVNEDANEVEICKLIPRSSAFTCEAKSD